MNCFLRRFVVRYGLLLTIIVVLLELGYLNPGFM